MDVWELNPELGSLWPKASATLGGGNHFGWRPPWSVVGGPRPFSFIPWHLPYNWGKARKTSVNKSVLFIPVRAPCSRLTASQWGQLGGVKWPLCLDQLRGWTTSWLQGTRPGSVWIHRPCTPAYRRERETMSVRRPQFHKHYCTKLSGE
jgi:hypothetical protein